MSESNPKYQQIVKTAKELFWKFGVKRVSIEEICREAKVSKMTFYKFFPNKRELAQSIINAVVGKSLMEFRELIDSPASFKEKVHRMFLIKFETAQDMSMEFLTDLYKNPDLELHELLEKKGQESMEIFVNFIEDSKRKGLIRSGVRIEFILAYQHNLAQMLENQDLISKYEKTEDFIMEAMNFLFYGIMPIETKSDEEIS